MADDYALASPRKPKQPSDPNLFTGDDLANATGAQPVGLENVASSGANGADLAGPNTAPAPAESGGWTDIFGGNTTAAAPPPPPPQATSRPPSPPPPAPTSDPFASIGGGVQLAGGEWVPKGHPLAAQAEAAAAPQATSPAPLAAAPTASPDPFASIGGGTQLPTGEWVPKGHPLAAQAGAPAAAAPSAPTAPGGIVTPPPVAPTAPLAAAPTEPVTPQAPAAPTVNTAYKDALMKMLTDNQTAPSLDDPALKGQSDAFALGQTRSRDAARSAMAERMAQEGGAGTDSGVFDKELAGLFQQQGEAQGGFNANLVGQELQNRRAQLIQAATLAGNQLSQDDQRALQKQLADTDAEIRRQQLSQQQSQFGQSLGEQGRQFDVDAELKRLGINTQSSLGSGDLALREKLGSGQLNLGLLSALMQGDQFNKGLGADLGKFNASQGNNYLQALLSQFGG